MKQGGCPKTNSGFTSSAWWQRRYLRLAGERHSAGFTIIEVLIVLSVTAILFVSAVMLINGRQNRTEFTVAINNAQQQLQQIVNETQSGYYGGGGFTCQGNTTGSAPSINSGTNQGCVYLGKVLQFGTDSDASQLIAYPIVGNQQYNTGGSNQQVDTLQHAYPTAVPSAQQTYELENGLHVVPQHTTHGAAGIISSLASYSGCSGYLCSGSQSFSLYGIKNGAANSPPNSAPADMISYINASAASNFDGTVSAVTVCLSSGTTNQSGLLSISGSGSLSVSLQIYGDTQC